MDALFEPYRDAEMTLPQLVTAAGQLLRRAAVRSADDRVSAVPDARTVRYYQTLGLVTRPARYKGRQALYGLEQLLQVLCVKLLQTHGYSLSQIQRALAGASMDRLEAAALDGLAGEADAVANVTVNAATPSTGAPAAPTPTTTPMARPLVSAELAPGVYLTVDPQRVVDAHGLIAHLARSLDSHTTSQTRTPGEETS